MESLSVRLKRLDSEVSLILRRTDISRLPSKTRDNLADLRQNLSDAKAYINNYELAETREEQLKSAKIARKWLKKMSTNIVTTSQADVFGPADVAQLVAQIEQMAADIK